MILSALAFKVPILIRKIATSSDTISSIREIVESNPICSKIDWKLFTKWAFFVVCNQSLQIVFYKLELFMRTFVQENNFGYSLVKVILQLLITTSLSNLLKRCFQSKSDPHFHQHSSNLCSPFSMLKFVPRNCLANFCPFLLELRQAIE